MNKVIKKEVLTIIKDCTFCGDIGRVGQFVGNGDLWQVQCRRCGARSGMHHNKKVVIQFWNRRINE